MVCYAPRGSLHKSALYSSIHAKRFPRSTEMIFHKAMHLLLNTMTITVSWYVGKKACNPLTHGFWLIFLLLWRCLPCIQLLVLLSCCRIDTFSFSKFLYFVSVSIWTFSNGLSRWTMPITLFSLRLLGSGLLKPNANCVMITATITMSGTLCRLITRRTGTA